MTLFKQTLKTIHDRLELPQPARARVLIEIAGDLDDLEAHFEKKGLSREDAQKRALEVCDLSDEAISQLIKVHAGWYRRFLERFSSQAKTVWERFIVIGLLLVIALITSQHVLSERFFINANPAVWPILGFTFLVLALLLPKYYNTYLKKDHNLKRLRTGLLFAPAAAIVNLLTGIYGFWISLYPILLRAKDSDENALPFIFDWLTGGSAMLIICFLTSILIVVLWFVLTNKIAKLEQAEVTLLLAE